MATLKCDKTSCSEYEFWNKKEQKCDDCPENCWACDQDSCSYCEEGYYLHENNGKFECVDTCPEGMTFNFETSKCKPCKDGCNICDNG